MPQDHRVNASSRAHAAFGKVMNIGAANADVLDLYLNLSGAWRQLFAFAFAEPELPESGELGNSHFLKS